MSSPAVIRLETAVSTQDLVHQLAAEGAPAGTAVVAREQSAGRGRRGRAWVSLAGGLWLSVLCRPAAVAALEVLSLRAGLLVAQGLESCSPEFRFGIKWPNDLMLGERKAGGILCEARWHGSEPGWVAVGLGVNVANPIPRELEAQAVALATVVPGLGSTELEPLAIAAIRAAGEASGPLSADELAEFAGRDWLRGRRLVAPTAGIAAGVGPDGALLVETAPGTLVTLRDGTVELA